MSLSFTNSVSHSPNGSNHGHSHSHHNNHLLLLQQQAASMSGFASYQFKSRESYVALGGNLALLNSSSITSNNNIGSSGSTRTRASKPAPRHQQVNLNVLLPNGLHMSVSVYDDSSLKEIKQNLWSKFKDLMQEVNEAARLGRTQIVTKPKFAQTTTFYTSPTNTVNLNSTASITIGRAKLSELFADGQTLPTSTTTTTTSNALQVICNSESEMKLKKGKKKLSLSFGKKRSPSLNFNMFSSIFSSHDSSTASSSLMEHPHHPLPMTVKALSVDMSADGTATINTGGLNRSLSMRKKMIGNLLGKFRRSSSFRSNSILPIASTSGGNLTLPNSVSTQALLTTESTPISTPNVPSSKSSPQSSVTNTSRSIRCK